MSICPSSCPHTLTDCISCTDMCLWITSTLNAHNTLRFWPSNRGSSGYAYSSRKLHQMAAIIVLIKQPHGTYASDGTPVLHFADKSFQVASAQILNFTVSIFSEIPLRCDLSRYVYVFVVHKLDFRFVTNETRCDVTFSRLYTPCYSETKDVIMSKYDTGPCQASSPIQTHTQMDKVTVSRHHP
jgi:hypothetical protein